MNGKISPQFCGWLKIAGGNWSRACVAPSWGACWKALLSCIDDVPPSEAPVACSLSLEATVNTGAHPDARRKPRQDRPR